MAGQSSREKMEYAKVLIEQKRYDEARDILRTVDHNMALDWMDKLDEIDPPKPKVMSTPQLTYQSPPVNYQVAQPVNDIYSLEVQQAYLKNYTNSAVIVLILYFVLWFPGVIVNAMYLAEASRNEKLAGRKLPGVEALRVEQFIFTWGVLILGIIFAIGVPFLLSSSDVIYQNIVRSL